MGLCNSFMCARERERKDAEIERLRGLLFTAENALDNAECAIDPDMNVEQFAIVQAARKLISGTIAHQQQPQPEK